MRIRTIFLVALTIILVMISNGYSQDNPNLVNELIDITKNYLVSKNELLVNGYSNLSLQYSYPLTSSFRKEVQFHLEKILKRRETLVACGQDYSDFQTELTVIESKIYKTEAVLKISEYTVLNLSKAAIDPLAPKTTEYVENHIFTFIYDGDGYWKLSSDKVKIPTSTILGPDDKKIINIEPTIEAPSTFEYFENIEDVSQSAAILNRSAINYKE